MTRDLIAEWAPTFKADYGTKCPRHATLLTHREKYAHHLSTHFDLAERVVDEAT